MAIELHHLHPGHDNEAADSNKTCAAEIRIRIGTGKPEWGAEPGKEYFVITWEAE